MSGYNQIVIPKVIDYNLRLLSIMDFEGRSSKSLLIVNDAVILNHNWYYTPHLVQGNYNEFTINLFMLDLCYNFLGDEGYDE